MPLRGAASPQRRRAEEEDDDSSLGGDDDEADYDEVVVEEEEEDDDPGEDVEEAEEELDVGDVLSPDEVVRSFTASMELTARGCVAANKPSQSTAHIQWRYLQRYRLAIP